MSFDSDHLEGDESPARNDLRNQFYFSDRSSQTYNSLIRTRGVSTEPPPMTRFSETVTQWAIYDAYQSEQDEAKKARTRLTDEELVDRKRAQADPMYNEPMRVAMKVMERLVNQNSEAEVFADFKFWEDQADQYRDGDGTLLPLWRFSSEKARRKQVTAISLNPRYADLFAVGYGSYDFLKQPSGLLCCFSLKNTKFPETTFPTDSGVCALHWHPTEPALLAVGFYDGSVAVYDVRSKSRKPVYQAAGRANKHTDPVWEVRWVTDESGPLTFLSISSDGKVYCWSLLKSRLEGETLFELQMTVSGSFGGLAGGLCFDFSSANENVFLCGTEEGTVYRCSRTSTSGYLSVHEGHKMAVYSVKWNPYHPAVFISASADWTVRMWHQDFNHALLVLDLGQAVGDVSWAPYSSTVFGAATADGILHFYDLNVNRQERILFQKVSQKISV